MTRSVIDSIAEQLDNGLNKITYIPNDSAVLTEPVELAKPKAAAPSWSDRVAGSSLAREPSERSGL